MILLGSLRLLTFAFPFNETGLAPKPLRNDNPPVNVFLGGAMGGAGLGDLEFDIAGRTETDAFKHASSQTMKRAQETVSTQPKKKAMTDSQPKLPKALVLWVLGHDLDLCVGKPDVVNA